MSEIAGNVENVKGEISQIKDFEFSETPYPLLSIGSGKGSKDLVNLYAKEAKKNLIALGTTGSGKTTSVLLPAISSLIKHNNCGIILDVKSELYEDIYHIAKLNGRENDLVFVGTQAFCTPINLLASLKNEEQLRNVIAACVPSSEGDNQSYWLSNGVDDVMNVVALDRWLHEVNQRTYSYNLNTLFDYIVNNEKVLSIYGMLKDKEDLLPSDIKNTYQKTLGDQFSLYNAALKPTDSDVQAQKTWRSGRVATALKPFTEEPFSSKLNNNTNHDTIHDLIFKQGKIIVLTIPIEYESVGFTLGKILREIYYKSVLSNSTNDRELLKLGDKFNRYTFLVIDEYQGFVNTSGANGVITDDTWGSISRSFENINIYATQSIRHLDNAIGETSSDVIMSNCASEIILRAQDVRTLEHIQRVYFNALGKSIEFLVNPTGFSCAARIEDNGTKHCVKGTMNIESQGIFHTQEYKLGKKDSVEQLLDGCDMAKSDLTQPQELFVANKSIDGKTVTLTNKSEVPVKEFLSTLETKLSGVEGFSYTDSYDFKSQNYTTALDFLTTPHNINLKKPEETIKLLRLATELRKTLVKVNYNRVMTDDGFQSLLKPNLINEDCLESDTLFVCGENYRAWGDVSSKLDIPEHKRISIKELKKRKFKVDESLICFVMGGGDLSGNQFNFYRNLANFNLLKKANPKSVVFSAFGHAGDAFIFDYLSDKSFITPTALAEYLGNLGYRKKLMKEESF